MHIVQGNIIHQHRLLKCLEANLLMLAGINPYIWNGHRLRLHAYNPCRICLPVLSKASA